MLGIKHLVSMNLALAIFGGASQVYTPTLEEIDTQRIRLASENNLEGLGFGDDNIVVDHSDQNNAIPHSIEKTLSEIKVSSEKLKSEMDKLLSEPHQVIEVKLDEKNDFGWYFMDEGAEYEPMIYVDMQTVEHWGIDDMNTGETIQAIFDEDGWELYGFIKGDEK